MPSPLLTASWPRTITNRAWGSTGFGVPVAGVERFEPDLANDPVVSIPPEAIAHYEVAGAYLPEVARTRHKIYAEFKAA